MTASILIAFFCIMTVPVLVPWLGFPPTVGLQGRWLHTGLGGGRVPSPSFYGHHGVFLPQHSPVLEQCLVHRGWPLVPEWLVGTHFKDLLLQMAVPRVCLSFTTPSSPTSQPPTCSTWTSPFPPRPLHVLLTAFQEHWRHYLLIPSCSFSQEKLISRCWNALN